MNTQNRANLLKPYKAKIGSAEQKALDTLTAENPSVDQVEKALDVLLSVIEPQCGENWSLDVIEISTRSSIANAAADLSRNLPRTLSPRQRTSSARRLIDRWLRPTAGASDGPGADETPQHERSFQKQQNADQVGDD